MVKLIYCINRKPELSVEEFHRYWRETHGPIAARIPGVRRYIQCHVVPAFYASRTPQYDGAAELWFDDMEAFGSAARSPEAREAAEDEKHFIDHEHSVLILTEEHPVIE